MTPEKEERLTEYNVSQVLKHRCAYLTVMFWFLQVMICSLVEDLILMLQYS